MVRVVPPDRRHGELDDIPLSLALGIGTGGDFAKYRVKFTGNTAQTVTVQCDAQTTAAL